MANMKSGLLLRLAIIFITTVLGQALQLIIRSNTTTTTETPANVPITSPGTGLSQPHTTLLLKSTASSSPITKPSWPFCSDPSQTVEATITNANTDKTDYEDCKCYLKPVEDGKPIDLGYRGGKTFSKKKMTFPYTESGCHSVTKQCASFCASEARVKFANGFISKWENYDSETLGDHLCDHFELEKQQTVRIVSHISCKDSTPTALCTFPKRLCCIKKGRTWTSTSCPGKAGQSTIANANTEKTDKTDYEDCKCYLKPVEDGKPIDLGYRGGKTFSKKEMTFPYTESGCQAVTKQCASFCASEARVKFATGFTSKWKDDDSETLGDYLCYHFELERQQTMRIISYISCKDSNPAALFTYPKGLCCIKKGRAWTSTPCPPTA